LSETEQRILDETLIQESLAGNQEAFGRLVARYQCRLTSYLQQILGEHEQALEISQESFIRAWSALDRYNPSYRFSTWLFRIGHNLAIDALRKRRLKTVSMYSETAEGGERKINMPDSGKNPLELMENSEMASELREAINELSEEYRELILLRHFACMNYQEMADFKKMPLGTIKNKLFRAHSVLRSKMADHR